MIKKVYSGGSSRSMFLGKNGNIYTCGYNCLGGLGLGHTKFSSSPEIVPGSEKLSVVDISSADHFLLLSKEQRVYSFGENYSGQCGLKESGATGYVRSVQEISSLKGKKIMRLETGLQMSFFISEDNVVYSCGRQEFGALGYHPQKNQKPNIVPLSKQKKIVSVSCGSNHTFFLTEDEKIYSCGWNCHRQLGRDIDPMKVVPIPSLEDKKIVKIAGGSYNSLFLSNEGKVYFCGRSVFSKKRCDIMIPEHIGFFDGKGVVDFSMGSCSAFFLTGDGKVYSCGSNYCGQLGHTDPEKSKFVEIPRLVDTLAREKIVQVNSGSEHTLFLSDKGVVFACGRNDRGQLGIGTLENCYLPKILTKFVVWEPKYHKHFTNEQKERVFLTLVLFGRDEFPFSKIPKDLVMYVILPFLI